MNFQDSSADSEKTALLPSQCSIGRSLRLSRIATRWFVIIVLAMHAGIGFPDEIEPLINLLKNDDWRVRESAAKALGRLGDKRALEPLITCLKDEDARVYKSAAAALANLGHERAVEPLIGCLKSRTERYSTAEALTKFGKPVVEPLITFLKDRDNGVREYAATVLGDVGDTRAIEPLISCLKENDREVPGDVRAPATDNGQASGRVRRL
jgi:HEAT repeat protein